MRKSMVVLGVTAVAVLTASCRAEVNVGLEVEEDRSGAVIVELGTDQELRDAAASFDLSPEDLTSEFDIPEIEGGYEREEGAMTFQGVRVEFDDIDELEDGIAGAAGSLADFTSFTFEMDDTSAVFDAALAPPASDELPDFPFDPSDLTGDFLSASFTLAMPGTVTEHNADEVLSDGTLRWDLPLLGGAQSDLHATSEFGGGGFPWLFVILGIVLLVGAGAMIGAVAMGKQQEKKAVSDAAAAHSAED